MFELKPDDLCGCGNGKRYGDCHLLIHLAPADKRIAVAQAVYAKEWAVNADHYQAQGIYAELAAELTAAGQVHHVLDIGCGRGQGLEAMLGVIPPEGRLVIGVDENPECLAAAAERLGLPVDDASLRRSMTEVLSTGAYRVRMTEAAIPPPASVALLNVDLMLKDAAFEGWLNAVGPLDGITLWFSGVHKARADTELVQVFEISNDREHRELLEDLVIHMAARRLRAGGLLQIAGRAAGPHLDGLKRDFGEELANALDGHPLEVLGVRGRRYSEPDLGAVIVASKMVTGRDTAVVSLIARRS